SKGAHRFSSFNNPFYRRSVELVADKVGREKTKWCAGCHDPVVLFTGQMGKATLHTFTYDQFEAQQGLACMACHSITEVKDLRGKNHYDTWHDSGVSGFAVRSFYDPPKTKACRDCHLPLIDSKEFGNRDGKIHDHVFPAANTALPTVRNDAQTIEDIRKKVLV